jgi:hypothetical protein
MLKTLINLRQKYKNWTQKQYNKHYYEYDFRPYFSWNIFDIDNEWVYDLEKWRNFIRGWKSVGYAFETWSYWMTDKPYGYKLPNAFWAELNDWWLWESEK